MEETDTLAQSELSISRKKVASELMRSKVCILGDNIAVFSNYAVTNGEMRAYIRKRFPNSKLPRQINFRDGETLVIRIPYHNYLIIYVPGVVEVPTEQGIRDQVSRVVSVLESYEGKINLNIQRESKNG